MSQPQFKTKTTTKIQTSFARDDLILARLDDFKDDIREVKERLDKINTRVDEIGERLNKVDNHLGKIDEQLKKTDYRLDKIDKRLDRVDERFERLKDDLRSTIWHSELVTLGALGIAVAVIVFIFTHIK